MCLRRWLLLVLCFVLLCIPVRAKPEPKYVALTFDDGPSGKYTRQLLEGLEQRGVKATFLLCGYRMKEDPQTTQRIFSMGHEIGLHGYSHKSMANMSEAEIGRELQDCIDLLPDGCESVFMRPPGGATTAAVKRAAKEKGLSILHWSVDPKDWSVKNATAVVQAVVTDVADGDVILLHDMFGSSVEAAFTIVDALLQRGFQFVTATELASVRNTVPQPGLVYTRFR